jgi:hypothetical protein
MGNFGADPMFVSLTQGAEDFHLSPGSPCIDAADPAAAPATDIEGNPRVADPASGCGAGGAGGGGGVPCPDMGAYEYQPS